MSHGRQKQIMDLLATRGECTVDFLADALRVSEMTIRRDLRLLAGQGLVVRSHGGAAPAENVLFEFSFLERRRLRRLEKEAIGKLAAELVPEGATVILDSGTTTLAVAQHLRSTRRLTVITTSLPIASVLQRSGNAEILLLGGILRRDSPDLEGPLTESNLAGLNADLAILGADGVDAAGTTYSSSINVARLLTKAISAAQKVFVTADSSKLNRTALSSFGNLKDFDGLITDERIEQNLLSTFRGIGIHVAVAHPRQDGQEARSQ